MSVFATPTPPITAVSNNEPEVHLKNEEHKIIKVQLITESLTPKDRSRLESTFTKFMSPTTRERIRRRLIGRCICNGVNPEYIVTKQGVNCKIIERYCKSCLDRANILISDK